MEVEEIFPGLDKYVDLGRFRGTGVTFQGTNYLLRMDLQKPNYQVKWYEF